MDFSVFKKLKILSLEYLALKILEAGTSEAGWSLSSAEVLHLLDFLLFCTWSTGPDEKDFVEESLLWNNVSSKLVPNLKHCANPTLLI